MTIPQTYFDWKKLTDEEIEVLDQDAWKCYVENFKVCLTYDEFKMAREQYRANLGVI